MDENGQAGSDERKMPVNTTWKDGAILPHITGSGCCWCIGVGDIFLAHFEPLCTTRASFKAAAFLSSVAEKVQPFMTTVDHLLVAKVSNTLLKVCH